MSYFQLFKPKYAYFILVVNLILFLLTPCFAKAEAIEKCEKYNKAGEGVFNFINNNPQIIRAIIQKVGEMADEYSHAVCQGVDREKAWEMEGNVISQIVTLFVGVGELNALAKAGKGAKLAKALDLATIGCFSKVFHCSSNSKFVKLVGEFMTLECFVAGTQIPTLEGLVNIENIRIHDFVASVDQKTGIKGFYEVVSLTQSHPTELYHVTYNDAQGDAYTLLTTGEHPFWVADKGWVAARQLAIADKLSITADTFVTVSSVKVETAPEGKTFTTYNFEVADTHSYFVLPEGKTDSSFAVWVHNTCGGKINARHIFHGEINKNGRPVGFHHKGSLGNVGKSRITSIISPVNSNGVYTATIEIFNKKTSQWLIKESTFFPDSWSRAKVLKEIRNAANNPTLRKGNMFEGMSDGVKIRGYYDQTGNINTAFPRP